jgi:tRNA modification GTPase
VGEGVVVCRTAPERIEIHCHGGKAAVAVIVEELAAAGFRRLDWRDWAALAEPDPLAAQARIALAEARTKRTAAILLDQYRGALRTALEALVLDLFSQQRESARERLDELLRFEALGLRLTRPWKVVLAGRPNVGKSSLINALLGYRRSIVHDTPGVTRDVVTASTALNGWPVEFADTAGVRESDDPLESAGVARTREELQTADLACLVFDAAQPWSAEDDELHVAVPAALVVHNKCDLVQSWPKDRPRGIVVSALSGIGLEELKQVLATRFAPDPPRPGAAVPFTAEQVQVLHDARRLIDAQEFAAAAQQLRALMRGNAEPIITSSLNETKDGERGA